MRDDVGRVSSPEMLGEIRDDFLKPNEAKDAPAIVLAAEGRHFSVGADFAFLECIADMGAS